MANIPKKLQQWLNADLLEKQQYEAILAFESLQPKRNTWIITIMTLGAAIIGLGIISIIAANWSHIPDGVKLGIDFALLIVLTLSLILMNRDKSSAWFEALLLSFILLCLASIGLISQIFHQQGELEHALLLWGVITFPVALFARHLFTPFLWSSLFLSGAILSIHSWNAMSWYLLPLLALLFTAFTYQISTHLPQLHQLRISLFFWLQITAVLSLAAIDLLRSVGEYEVITLAQFYPLLALTVLISIGILIYRDYKWLNKIILLVVLALLMLYYLPDVVFSGDTQQHLLWLSGDNTTHFWLADDIRAPVITILILLLYAIHAGNMGYQNTFSLITFLLGLRFLILYFQAFGGLAATGIGLIISGAIIMGVAWFWYKKRRILQSWVEELS